MIKIIFVFMFVFCANCSETINPKEPVYQLDWGVMPPGNMWIAGGWSEREIPEAKTAAEQELKIKLDNMAVMAEKGRKAMRVGISAIVLGIILLLYLNNNPLQWVGGGVFGFGIWRFASGLIEVKLAEQWQIVTGALFVGLIVITAGVMLWNRGLNLGKFKNLFKRKGK